MRTPFFGCLKLLPPGRSKNRSIHSKIIVNWKNSLFQNLRKKILNKLFKKSWSIFEKIASKTLSNKYVPNFEAVDFRLSVSMMANRFTDRFTHRTSFLLKESVPECVKIFQRYQKLWRAEVDYREYACVLKLTAMDYFQ